MSFFKLRKKLAQIESKTSRFRQWKSGKRWLYGASVLLAFAGMSALVVPQLLHPQVVYAVTNGTVTVNQGILMNSGAVEVGNPQGRVYCIDEGTYLEPGALAGLSDTGSGAAGVTWATLTTNQRFQIQTLGWLSFNNSQTSAAGDTNMYLAAQCLVWDISTGNGLPASSGSSAYNPNHLGEGADQAWYEATPSYDPATMVSDMDFLLAQYQNFLKTPAFNASNQTIHLGQTATFTDSNKVLSAYSNLTSTNGLKPSISGNTLTVTPTQAGTGTVTLSNGGVSDTDGTANSGGVDVWFTNNANGTAGQNLIYAEHSPEQQVQVSVKVIPSAALKVIKLDTDTNKPIAGAVFEGLNKEGQVVTKDADGNPLANGGKFTTGADGTLVVDNLMDDPQNVVGGETNTIVTLREVSVPAPFTLSNNLASVVDASGNPSQPSTDLPVALVAGTTSSNPTGVTFSDKAQVQAIRVQKTAKLGGKQVSDFPNGNYSLEGAEFTVKDVTQGTTLGKLYSDDKGQADLSALIKTGGSHQSAKQYQALLNQLLTNGDSYSIQETGAPNGLARDWNGGKPQNFNLSNTGDDTQLLNPSVEDTTNQNTDTPLTVSSTLTKIDSDTQSDQTQGAGLLQGTIETLFYRVDVKDSSGKMIHKANTPVQWTDGFSALPIALTSGKKVDDAKVTLQVANNVNTVGVKNLPITATTTQAGYYWKETDATGNLTPGFGYTDNTATFDVASGEGDDGTGITSGVSVINGADTNLKQADHVLTLGLEFTKVLADNGSLTGEDGAEFSITPQDKGTLPVKDGVEGQNSTATSGDATSFDGYTVAGLTKFKFAIGNYVIHQTKVPTGTQSIQDIKVSFTPDATPNGAPKTYTLTVSWADGNVIYSKSFTSDDFTDGNNNLINVNLGTLSDNKLTPPSIETQASDRLDGDQTLGVGSIKAQDDATINNLVAGDYTEVTHWVNSSTGEAIVIDGKPLLATQDFTSTGLGSDQVTTQTTFNDVSLQGQKLTAEEFVYHKGDTSGTPVVSERNYKTNPSQTLSVETGKGQTQAQVSTITPSKQTIPDTYKGSGFEAGQKVVVKVDSVFDHTLNKEVPASGSATFTADQNGNVSGVIQVTVDATQLAGHDVTFFESTVVDNQPVFQMHDKNATSETVHVNLPVHTPSTPQNIANITVNALLPHTGDASSWIPTGIGVGLLLSVLGFLKRHTLVKAFLSLKARILK